MIYVGLLMTEGGWHVQTHKGEEKVREASRYRHTKERRR
jgi:hypothetical protein